MKTLRIAVIVFLWLALSSIVSAQTFEADGVKFVRIPDLESKGYFGYNFVRVQVSFSG